jgi:hypothetical protein
MKFFTTDSPMTLSHARRLQRALGVFPNPNGIPSLSPGLRAGRYPGSTSQSRPNPERVASIPCRSFAQRFNLFRVDDSSSFAPRVARASQPWAEGCNPFGIGTTSHCAETQNQSTDASSRSPSPLNGERAGVRGGNLAARMFPKQRRETNHPSPSFPLPVEGRGRPVSERRFPNRCAARCRAPAFNPVEVEAPVRSVRYTTQRALGVRTRSSPSPRPSPQGRGRTIFRLSQGRGVFGWQQRQDISQSCKTMLPLLQGEGWGEGERGATSSLIIAPSRVEHRNPSAMEWLHWTLEPGAWKLFGV